MPKRSNDFQKLIAFIEQEFAPYDVQVTESAMVPDLVNAVEREIDVLIEGTVGDHTVSIGVECRDRKKKGDVTWIDEIIGKYQHLPIHKRVAVSKIGFTKTAVAKADKHNIQTLTFENALKNDWLKDYVRVVDWMMEGRRLIYKRAGFEFADSHIPEDFDGTSILRSENGRILGPAQDLVDWLYSSPPIIEKAIEHEMDKMRDQFKAGINVGRLQIEIGSNFIYESGQGVQYPIRRILVDIECRVEKIKPGYNEYIYNKKYVALAKAKPQDNPTKFSVAVVKEDKAEDTDFRWFFSLDQKSIE